ncbi:MAG TPA: beta-propeller fold lactonase family protein [Candidatus Baltobacteraceae bacterium]|jgi:YVTN family beta-propeller protein|nr:beta-propeller fold lactonase family protein [Candidatus Baltobacteraceae bacterium]
MSASRGTSWAVAVLIVIVIAAGIAYTHYFRIPTDVAYVTEEDDGISVIDLNTLEVIKRIHPQDVAPRGLGLTFDGKYLVTADKDTADAAVIDTRRMEVVRKLHVGDNPEFVKLDPTGQWLFTSYEPGSTGGPPKEGAEEEESEENEPPSEVVEFNTHDWARGLSFVAGKETEGLEFSPDGKLLIVANEAQDNLGVYDIATGKQVKNINLASYGKRPRGVKVSPSGNGYAVTMEGSGTLLLLDPNFNVVKTIQTAAKPYGVAFDRDGKRIFVVAAAAHKLQVFTADTLQQIGEAPLGQRCWHFTFTPDNSKLLFACGRSNNVYVLDATTYKQIKVIGGFQTPWGILTYPRAYGSLGLP